MQPTQLFCKIHNYYSPSYIILSEQNEYLLKCVQCTKQAQYTQGSSILVIQELLESNEFSILDNWPPLDNNIFNQELKTILKSDIQKDLEINVSQFFCDLKQKILKKLDLVEKKAIAECIEFRSQKQNILDAYNRMAEKEKLKKLFSNQNLTFEEINSSVFHILQKKYHEARLNSSALQNLVQKLKNTEVDFSESLKIQNNIISSLDGIDFFKGIIAKEIQHNQQQMKISIKNSGAKLITLNVNESDTTENIKLKIQEQEGIPLEKQCLIYQQIKLQEGRTLQDYGLSKDSTIQMIIRPEGTIDILVYYNDENCIVLNVQTSNTIQEVKEFIKQKLEVGSRDFHIAFGGKSLNVRTTLSYNSIQHDSILKLQR